MFTKDTFRLIRNTFKRFLTLFFIVLIGVAFMTGLLCTPEIMRQSVDRYYDENNIMDIQLYSSYGFCQEDITALKGCDAVERLTASRFVDAYAGKNEEYTYVTRFQEADSDVNGFQLVEGRLPMKNDEAVVLTTASFGRAYRIGDVINVYSDVEETMNQQQFTIVGTVKSGQYMAATKETSTLDNKEIDVVVYVRNSVFTADYYTTVYLTLKDCRDVTGFTSQYEELAEKRSDELQILCDRQQEYYKETIREEAQQKIDDGTRELQEKIDEAEAEIAEAEQLLSDSNIKLIIFEAQIESNEITLKSSEKVLDENEKLLVENKKKVDNGIKKLEEESGMTLEEAYAEITATYYYYTALQNQLGQSEEQLKPLLERKAALQKQKEENLAQIEEYRKQIQELDVSADDYLERLNELNSKIQQLEDENTQIDATIRSIDLIADNYTDENIQNTLDELDAQAGGSVVESYAQIKALYEANQQIEDGMKQIEDGRKQLEEGKKALAEGRAEVERGRRQYEAGLKELNENKKKFALEVEDARNELKKAQQQIDDLPKAQWTVLNRDRHYSAYMYKNTIKQMRAICIVMPVLFFLVAALVCMTTMTRLIDEQRSQIGIFSALGFSANRIASKYMLYSFIATFTGSIIAVPIGIAIFPTVIYFCWKLMYDLPDMLVFMPAGIGILCVCSFIVLMLSVTWLVAKKSLKEMPAMLMRPKAPKSAKKTFIENITFIWKRLNFTSKVTARNLIRYKSRFFMTVLGVAGCTGLLIVGFGVKDAIVGVVDIQYDSIINYNNTIILDNDIHVEDVVETISADLDNQKIVEYETYIAKTEIKGEEDTISVYVFDPREINTVYDLRNRRSGEKIFLDNSGVVVSEKFATNNKIKVNDYIEMTSSAGIKAKVKVTAICEMYANHYLFMSKGLYETIFDEKYHTNQIAVYTLSPEKLKADMENCEDVISVIDFSATKQSFETMLDALDYIILVILIAAGSLALVVIINLTEVNISERVREIATLKVLGFYDGEVNSYIFKEIMILTFIGSLAGMPLGKMWQYFIMHVINMDMVMFGTTIKVRSYIYSFVITMMFAFFVLLLMRKSLKNVKMIESLKSVE